MNERFVYSKQKGFNSQQTRPTHFVDGNFFQKHQVYFIYLFNLRLRNERKRKRER